MTNHRQLTYTLHGFPWGDFEQHVVKATLDFANMGLGVARGVEQTAKRVSLADEVEKLFTPFAREMLVVPRPKKGQRLFSTVPTRGATLLTGVVLKRRIVETYQDQQQELREALDSIHEGSTISPTLNNRLDRWLGDIPFRFGFKQGSMVYRFAVPSVAAGWALGLGVLLESEYPLRQCGECSRYFAIFDPRKRNQLYCSTNCAKNAEKEKSEQRVEKWRKNKRRQEKKSYRR